MFTPSIRLNIVSDGPKMAVQLLFLEATSGACHGVFLPLLINVSLKIEQHPSSLPPPPLPPQPSSESFELDPSLNIFRIKANSINLVELD